jgi:FlaA1/EpsC-like NDP-sugar epimerase
MIRQFFNLRFYIVMAVDIMLFIIAFVGAYLLRFDFNPDRFYWAQMFAALPFLLPGKIVIFFLFGMYEGMWRYASLHDLRRLLQATLLSMLFYISGAYVFGFNVILRSIFLLDAILTFLLVGGLRMGIRLYYQITCSSDTLWPFRPLNSKTAWPKSKSVLIVGAGGAGEKMLREIIDNPHLNYEVVGFLDDDHSKWGRSLHGRKVLGGVDLLPEVIQWQTTDEVLIATPCATGPQMRRIIETCKACDTRYRTLPEIGAIIDGKVSIKNLRDVRYEDLLRRPPVRLDTTGINRYLQDKRVLVTGAGGSIGSELCRQISRFNPQELILVDASEAALFAIQMELQHELGFPRYRGMLGRVQDQPLMEGIFKGYRPHLIFHAAAFKHVPLLEHNPWKAITNNVVGSRVIMDLAVKYQVERFVLVSTDKAVRPTNVMGASKRLTELILQTRQGNGVRFMAVRFGNVIGSSGSVLPLFRRQLEQGGPITVTHPEVTRYFMTIPEAAQLILQAGGLGQGGEIFILEMGTPIKIAKMAEELVQLSGKVPGKDIEIIFTGLREGEKLHEELITQSEGIVATEYEKIMVLRATDWNGMNTQAEFRRWLDAGLEDLKCIALKHDGHAIKAKLRELLPEYVPQQDATCALPQQCATCKGVAALAVPAGQAGDAAPGEASPEATTFSRSIPGDQKLATNP